MDGIAVVRVVRQVRIIRTININQPSPTQALVAPTPPAPKPNNRFLNAVSLLIIYTIGIGSIVLGTIHLNDCPAEKMLPTGLIILGGMMMVSRLLNCVYDCRSVTEEQSNEDTPPCLVLLNLLFLLAEFGMFIAVCYWAFHVSPTNNPDDKSMKDYCDYGLYMTSFYGCILGLIFYALPFTCACCLACCR